MVRMTEGRFEPLRRADPDFFVFDWLPEIVHEWAPDTHFALGTIRRPLFPCGHLLECTHEGRSGVRQPAITSVAGTTVRDGSAVWTIREPGDVALPVIESCVYAVTPTGGPDQISNDFDVLAWQSRVRLDAIDAPLGLYRVQATMTDNYGEEYVLAGLLPVVE